jgi:MYXO-CTERM domain-containing protein
MGNRVFVALFGVAAAAGASLSMEGDASACGGCFTPPPPPNEVESVITDERMIFSISKDQTTLYDQIRYSGSPSSFAWVLPVKGTVTVGLSADIMFNVIDQTLTASQVVEPPTDCPPPPTCANGYFGGAGSTTGATTGASGFELSGEDAGVTVTSQAQVGPYETVQLHSTDGSALTNWLDSHGYQIAPAVVPVIAEYVAGQFDFLALKLVPGAGVQSMQPVRVTSNGAGVSLPLRMVAIGTGATTGISIWVVGDGRWEPQNFPFFTIKDSEISWDWNTSSSNYETLRLSKEAALKGRGWQFESSLELNQNTIRQDLSQAIYSNSYTQSPVGGYLSAGGSSPEDAGTENGSVGNDSGDAGATGASDSGAIGADSTNAQLDAATKDLDVLFAGIAGPNARITRLRSDVAHSALTSDMVLQASSDPSEVSNLHYPQKQIGQPECPVYKSTTCSQTGTLPRDQAIAAASKGGVGGVGCSATRGSTSSRAPLAIALGLVGLAAIRNRRRRNPR